jgi:hypothetical protein
MKKFFLLCSATFFLLSFAACGNKNDINTTNNNTISNSSNDISSNSSKKTARISFDINDKSTKTYKEHVQDLWNKTKVILKEDAKKNYSDEEFLNIGKELDLAWVNLQCHVSIASNKHDKTIEDTKDELLGKMVGNMLLDIDKIYGQRSLGDAKEKIAERRKEAISYLDETIKDYDEILAKVTVK